MKECLTCGFGLSDPDGQVRLGLHSCSNFGRIHSSYSRLLVNPKPQTNVPLVSVCCSTVSPNLSYNCETSYLQTFSLSRPHKQIR
jgi:hypothetical protein